MDIRIEKPGVKGNLHLHFSETERIQLPTSWNNCNIVVSQREGGFVMTDKTANVEVHAVFISAQENVKPVY